MIKSSQLQSPERRSLDCSGKLARTKTGLKKQIDKILIARFGLTWASLIAKPAHRPNRVNHVGCCNFVEASQSYNSQ